MSNQVNLRIWKGMFCHQLVFFDGKIPHTIKTQNIIGPSYRFTISLFFIKK